MPIQLLSTVLCVVVVLSPANPACADGATGSGAAANNTVDLQQPPVAPAAPTAHDPGADAGPQESSLDSGESDSIAAGATLDEPSASSSKASISPSIGEAQPLQLPPVRVDDVPIHNFGMTNEPSFAIPERERKPIGQPRPGPANVLGQSTHLDREGGADSWWSKVDPRTNDLTRVLGALGIVIGLIMVTRVALRRGGQSFLAARRPSGVVEILARYPIGRGEQIMLLKLVRRVVLLHRAGSTMTVLTEITDPDEVALLLARVEAGSSARHADHFHELLDRLVIDGPRGSKRSIRAVDASTHGPTEVIDLTRSSRRGVGRMLGLSRGAT